MLARMEREDYDPFVPVEIAALAAAVAHLAGRAAAGAAVRLERESVAQVAAVGDDAGDQRCARFVRRPAGSMRST